MPVTGWPRSSERLRAAVLVLGFGLVLVPLGLAALAYQSIEDRRFAAEGVRTEGLVLAKEVATRSTRQGGVPEYRVTYRFLAADGAAVTGTAAVRRGVWERLAERGPIGLTYLPRSPWPRRVEGQADADARPIGIFALVAGVPITGLGALMLRAARRAGPAPVARHRPSSGWARGLGLALILLSLVPALIGLYGLVEEVPYAAGGRTAEGRVEARTIAPAGRGGERRTRYRVSYSFTTADGRPVGGTGELAVVAWEALRPGDPIAVEYLPSAPGTNRPASRGGVALPLALLGGAAAAIALGWGLMRHREGTG